MDHVTRRAYERLVLGFSVAGIAVAAMPGLPLFTKVPAAILAVVGSIIAVADLYLKHRKPTTLRVDDDLADITTTVNQFLTRLVRHAENWQQFDGQTVDSRFIAKVNRTYQALLVEVVELAHSVELTGAPYGIACGTLLRLRYDLERYSALNADRFENPLSVVLTTGIREHVLRGVQRNNPYLVAA